MQVYDIEMLAVAARSVADMCKEAGFEGNACQIMPLKKKADGTFESAVISRFPVGSEGSMKMVAVGWKQEAKEFSWADTA